MNTKITKPISSPGRSEKYPPPLMRFLRTNVGSKSRRSRSRATPMFLRKKNTIIETTQEPSSPKVTCIGQVVVRRSNKNKKTTAAATSLRHHHRNRLCRCLRTLKPTSFRSVWSKWVSFFRCGYCKKSRDLHVSPVIQDQEQERENENENVTIREADTINQGLISPILLTRCRSATYTSCSLGSMFRESTSGEDEVAGKMKILMIKKEVEVSEVEDGGVKAVKVSPLILSRCKSEPATTWDRILV